MNQIHEIDLKNPKRKKLASNLTLQRLEEAVSSTSSRVSEQSISNSGEPFYNIQHESAEVDPNNALSHQELARLQTGDYTSLDGMGAFPKIQGSDHVVF